MGLTTGSGPFGDKPAGRFNFTPDPPTGSVLYFDPVPHRLRGFLAGEAVFDTVGAKLLYETAHLPVYYVPEDDLRHELLEPSDKHTRCPHKGEASYRSLRVGDRFEPDAVWTYPEPIAPAAFLVGHAAFYWKKLDEWFVEDEQVFGHPRDPYHRIDTYRTSRPVRVSVDGEMLAESTRGSLCSSPAYRRASIYRPRTCGWICSSRARRRRAARTRVSRRTGTCGSAIRSMRTCLDVRGAGRRRPRDPRADLLLQRASRSRGRRAGAGATDYAVVPLTSSIASRIRSRIETIPIGVVSSSTGR